MSKSETNPKSEIRRTELEKLILSCSDGDFEARLHKLQADMLSAARSAGYESDESKAVAAILRTVAEQGDEAVAGYTEKFDGVMLRPEEFRIAREALEEAHRSVDPAVMESLRKAIRNVRDYQTRIFIRGMGHVTRDTCDGTGIRYTPIRRIGVCVPGAAAPLPSTVVMTVVPAQVAGVKEIAVVSPPRYRAGEVGATHASPLPAIRNPQSVIGTIHPVILAVCHELGVNEVYRIGGAQAVAALAYGCRSIPKVDMIVGPGNKWVQHAKKNVAGDTVGIDSIAGPSEVLIIANDEANPAWVAADMLSQAEHAADSSAIVLTASQPLARAILDHLRDQLASLPRAADAAQSLGRFSRIIVVESIGKAIELADAFASEHLEVQCGTDSRRIAERITNAGAIFIGSHTPVAVGDYWAGPSHTLPTAMTARFSSALTSNDFVKSISVIEYTAEQLAASADDIIRLAETEGLDAHARSVRIRQQK